MDTECEGKHSWGFQVEETLFLPLVGHCVCVLRNTLCLHLEFGVGDLGRLPLIVRCTVLNSELGPYGVSSDHPMDCTGLYWTLTAPALRQLRAGGRGGAGAGDPRTRAQCRRPGGPAARGPAAPLHGGRGGSRPPARPPRGPPGPLRPLQHAAWAGGSGRAPRGGPPQQQQPPGLQTLAQKRRCTDISVCECERLYLVRVSCNQTRHRPRGGWTLNYSGTLNLQAPHMPLYRCTQGLWGGGT
eukprot:1191926-Prorocentrum_minimum.AAC.2